MLCRACASLGAARRCALLLRQAAQKSRFVCWRANRQHQLIIARSIAAAGITFAAGVSGRRRWSSTRFIAQHHRGFCRPSARGMVA